MCICVFTCAWEHMCRGPTLILCIFLDYTLPGILRWDLSLSSELTHSASLASQLALTISCLCFPCFRIIGKLPYLPTFYVGPGNLNSGPYTCMTLLTEPSPQDPLVKTWGWNSGPHVYVTTDMSFQLLHNLLLTLSTTVNKK